MVVFFVGVLCGLVLYGVFDFEVLPKLKDKVSKLADKVKDYTSK